MQAEQTYNMLSSASQHKTNPAQLEKFAESFLRNYRNMNSFSKYFVFGNTSTTCNLSFVTYDSFTRQRVQSSNALVPALTSLYNFGVSLSRRGCYMDLAGDGIKNASNFFRQAAWIFEQLLSMST